MAVHTLRIDDELDARVRAEAERRHKGNLSDMFRDLITVGFTALPPLDVDDLSPLPTSELEKALAAMPEEDWETHQRLAASATRVYPKAQP